MVSLEYGICLMDSHMAFINFKHLLLIKLGIIYQLAMKTEWHRTFR